MHRKGRTPRPPAACAQAPQAPDDGGASALELEGASERTCIVCHAAHVPEELLRLQYEAGRVYVAPRARGRGAWVCARLECLSAISPKALARAFKGPILEPFAPAELVDEAECLAERRVLEMIGLARRQQALAYGAEMASTTQPGEGLVIVAEDAAERTRASVNDPRRIFVSTATLSKAAGLCDVTAVRINPGRLAHQAAYWLSVWYECRSRAARTSRV